MQNKEEELARTRAGFYGGDDTVTYDVMRTAATAFISASYAYQTAKYGKIMVRLSPEAEMR